MSAAESNELARRVRWPGAMLSIGGVLQVTWTAISNFALGPYLDELLEGLRALSPAGQVGGGMFEWWNTVSIVVSVVIALVIIAGGLQMTRGRSWGLSLAAAVAAMFPCFAPCCGLLIPVGIWAVFVLNDPLVRAEMR
jgi:uncharacterized membrane protein (UPF0136 family)